MWFGLITLFPDMFAALDYGITGRAKKNGLIQLQHWNPRDYSTDKHKSVDDSPYGGGPGMVMMPEPLRAAIGAAKAAAPTPPTVVFLSPQGRLFNQDAAVQMLEKKSLILLAGRYEGVDERIIEEYVDEEWSIGDYILSGGELPAMIIIDTLTRLLPNAVNDENSILEDSITSGLLKYPQYTRPESFGGRTVPTVLLSGNHEQIRQWRLKESLRKTSQRRPDLLEKYQKTPESEHLLTEFIKKTKK